METDSVVVNQVLPTALLTELMEEEEEDMEVEMELVTTATHRTRIT